MMHFLKKNICLTLLAFSLIFTSIPTVPAYAAKATRTANIYSFEGEVTIKRGGDKTLPAFEGMRLSPGDTILTGSKSKAVVSIDSDKTITVDANTEITLDDLSGDQKKNKTSTSVFYGSTVNTVKNKLEEGSSFDTKTSSAVMGVRGTSYLVRQDQNEVEVIVGSGIVAVTPIVASGQETSEPIPVAPGEQIRHNAIDISIAPTPIDSETILHLSPVVADELITEEMFQSISNKPDSIHNRSELLQILQKQEDEREKEVKKQEEDRKNKQSQTSTTEPPAFYASGGTLSGQSNSLLHAESTPVVLPDATHAAPAAFPVDKPSDRKGATDTPNTQEALPPITEYTPETAPIPETGNGTQTVVPPSDNSGGNTSSGGSSNNGSGGGSNNGAGGDSGGDSGNGSGGGSTEKPIISIKNLQQDTVNADPPLALIVSWDKSSGIMGHTVEIKQPNGTYAPLFPQPDILEHASTYRIVFPENTRNQLHQAVLRITPVVSANQQAVSNEIRLDFDTPSSGRFKQLAMPKNLLISDSDMEYELTFDPVPDCSQYRISLYQEDTFMRDFLVSGTSTPVVVSLGDQVPDRLTAKVIALGNQFDRWNSLEASVTFTASPTLPKLATPSGVLVVKDNSATVYWDRVPAVSTTCSNIEYAIYYSAENIVKKVGYVSLNGPGDIAYDIPQNMLQYIDQIKIGAYDPCGHYESSDWGDVRSSTRAIVGDWPQTMLSDPPISQASPSDASPSDAWYIGNDDEDIPFEYPEDDIPIDPELGGQHWALLPTKEDLE